MGLAAHPGGHHGAALAVEDLQAQGIRIRLREASREGASTSGVTAVALAQAFDVAGVVAVVGHSVSGATLSAAHILNQRGIPMIIPNATSPLLTGVGPWVFRICPSDHAQGELLATYAFRQGYRRAGVLYVLDDYGKGLSASFARAFSQKGGELALAVGYASIMDRPAEDLTPYLTILRNAALDVLFLAARTRDIVQLRGGSRLAEPGWPPVLGGDAVLDPLDVGDGGRLFEGMTVTAIAPPKTTAALRFAERYRERFGAPPDNASYACYDALLLVGAAVREAGPSRQGIQRYLRRLGRDLPAYEGVTGRVRFDEGGDSIDARFAMARVHAGALEILEP